MSFLHSEHFSELTDKLYSDLQNLPFYEDFYVKLQDIAASDNVNVDCFESSILTAIKKTGLETEFRNQIYHWLREQNVVERNNLIHPTCWLAKEPVGYLRKAQMHWERKIYKSLNSMCAEIGVSLSCIRIVADRDEILEKWNMLSTYDIDLSRYRPVYAPKDFMEVLLSIENPNYKPDVNVGSYNFSRVPLKVKSLRELRELYCELTKKEPFLGSCPDNSFNNSYNRLETETIAKGKKVLEYNHAPITRQFLRKPVPHSLRGDLWLQVLGCSHIGKSHEEYFTKLKQLVAHYSMLVDKLIIKDVRLTVSNDDQYFVFEDVIYQVILCFSRDTAVLSIFHRNASNPLATTIKNKSPTINNSVIYPPNGVIPFHGFSMYAAPFCYMYDDVVKLYFSIRSFYTNYLFRLHEVSSHQQGILSLCVLFNQLLQQHEQQLWSHFKAINVDPSIKIVFKWIMRCFSGYLPPEQLLYLWDLILGYDSLEIIPLLAVAVLSFRRDNLLQTDSMQLIEAVLADLSSLRIIPLLQFSLGTS